MSALNELNARLERAPQGHINIDASVGTLSGYIEDLVKVVNEQQAQTAALQLDLGAARRAIFNVRSELGLSLP